jgi:hypothetical protein
VHENYVFGWICVCVCVCEGGKNESVTLT